MDLRTGILETAQALGMDPVDLATIISYETAGTFDPLQRGPTTQWGQHRGLIQFGEPQAREYGVDWNNPLASQLGPDGAVARYFRQNGWQPGMSMLDAYSIVNAGGPGLYNRSDANNGGAPGTVRDKVENQMAGHREKALGLIGREYAPPPVRPEGGPLYADAGQPQNALAGFMPSQEQINALLAMAEQQERQNALANLGTPLNPADFMMRPAPRQVAAYDTRNPFGGMT